MKKSETYPRGKMSHYPSQMAIKQLSETHTGVRNTKKPFNSRIQSSYSPKELDS